MAIATFDVRKGFKEVFGLQAPLFGVSKSEGRSTIPTYPKADAYQEQIDGGDRVSVTGNVIPDRLRFVAFGEEFALPIETVATYELPHNIQRTSMNGKPGTVKEYWSLDDWSITLKGFLINYEEMRYPSDQKKDLLEFFKQNYSYEVRSDWMSEMGIYNVVVSNLRFPAMPGSANVQPFEIAMYSDGILELDLIIQ